MKALIPQGLTGRPNYFGVLNNLMTLIICESLREIGEMACVTSAWSSRGQTINAIKKIESLSKPRRQRQRECHKTKGLMSRTIAVHVRYKSLYIFLPSSAKQQREMTTFAYFGERELLRLILHILFCN